MTDGVNLKWSLKLASDSRVWRWAGQRREEEDMMPLMDLCDLEPHG
jgi:hypothetical protein